MPIVFSSIKRYLGLRAATLALGLYLPVVLSLCDFQVFTYVNLLALPLALYYASMSLFMEFRSTIFGAVAAIALAAAADAALSCIVMLPFHVLVVAVTARQPIFAVVAACLAFAITFSLDSMDSAGAIAQQLATIPFAVGLVISAGAVMLAARMRPQGFLPASMSTPDRVRAVMTGALLYTTVSVALACSLLIHVWPQPRYFAPAAVPFVYLVAERLGTLENRATLALGALESLVLLLLPFAPYGLPLLQVPVVAIVVLYGLSMPIQLILWRKPGYVRVPPLWPSVVLCLYAIGAIVGNIVVVSKRGGAQAFTLAEAERVVPKLYSAGYTYPEILGSIQGPAADDLISLLAHHDPNIFGEAPRPLRDENFSLLVVKVPNDAIARTRSVVATIPVNNSRSVVVVRGERSYLDWVHMRRCIWIIDPPAAPAYRCKQVRTDQALSHNRPFVELMDSLPLSDAGASDRAYDRSVHFEVAAHTPGRGAPHIIRTANQWPAAWTIARVSGVEFEGELPGVEIRLPDTREATGVVELEFTAIAPGDPPWLWLPHVMEVTDDNAHLLGPLRSVQ